MLCYDMDKIASYVSVKLGLSHSEKKSQAEGVLEKGAKEDIWD